MNTDRSDDESPVAEESVTWADAREYTRHQALIEQAKGMLMFVYGIDADEAFTVLRAQSQDHNIKLRLIAEQVVKDMVELVRDTKGPARRRAFDGVMATAHHRIATVATRQLDGQSKTGVQMKDLGHAHEHR